MSALLPVYPRLPLRLVRASGTTLYIEDGREILDLYGGHAVTPLGHGHPELQRTIAEAFATLDFYSNSLHMPVQEQAAEAVLHGSAHLAYAHFVNSGTEANEAALHTARRMTGREKVLTLSTGFHGRSLASLSATGLPGYRRRISVDMPSHWRGAIEANDPAALDAIDEDTAAVLLESIVSLGGVQLLDAQWLHDVQAKCRAVGAMLIFDEVQGGVGRLGEWFAHTLYGIEPDMVTLAKSVAGGYPVGVMLATQAIGDWIGFGELGTTFGGGPVACAMVKAVHDIIVRDGLMHRVTEIFDHVSAGLAGVEGVEVRGKGALIGIQTPLLAKELRSRLLEHNILIGVSGDPHTARLLLPYTTSNDELDRFLTTLPEVLID